ncbi:MAG: type II toxin-antitoxin system RelE/ParE family toxin [Desulfomonile tiedjei]|nr:type II toxin-antitoxin system RelE/ParE family toxin [Desulfomonile tiedjei]
MPRVEIIFYKEEDEIVPVADWLRKLPPKPRLKCVAWIRRLQTFGHELQRPYADYLRDGIYELRVGLAGINYRLLYFFYGKAAVVLSHGIVKERTVPPLEIDKAAARKREFEQNPQSHIFVWERSSWEKKKS